MTSSLHDFRKFKLPQQGGTFTKISKSSTSVVEIISQPDTASSLFNYAESFFSSAHIVTDTLLNAQNPSISDLDTMFFALAFLYRHSMELLLKAIAFKYIRSDTDREAFIKDTFHNLSEILSVIEPFIRPWKHRDPFDWLCEYLEDLSSFDKNSDSFRYPFHIKYDVNSKTYSAERIFEKQTHIDLIKFANKFEAAYEIVLFWYNECNDYPFEWFSLQPIFIEEGGDYYSQSVVGYEYTKDDFYPYISAYTSVAFILFESLNKEVEVTNGKILAKNFLPMCYSYRNCIELGLKSIWFQFSDDNLQTRYKKIGKKKHSIIGLWNLVEPSVMKETRTQHEQDFISALFRYLEQLHKIDPESCKFRYPITRQLLPLFSTKESYDYVVVQDFFESIVNALDCIHSQLSEIAQYEAEMHMYYSPD